MSLIDEFSWRKVKGVNGIFASNYYEVAGTMKDGWLTGSLSRADTDLYQAGQWVKWPTENFECVLFTFEEDEIEFCEFVIKKEIGL